MRKFVAAALFCAVMLAQGQQTPNQILSSAASYQGLSDRDLRISTTYLLTIIAGQAATPSLILSNAAAFQGMSDRELQIASTYLLSQIQSGVNTNQFTSSGTIKSGSFQTNNQFFATSSSVLVLSSGSNIVAQFTPIGGTFIPNGLVSGQLVVSNGGGANAIIMNSDGTAVFGNSITSSNGFLAKSNVLASIPALVKGDTYYWSSNGVAYVICSSPTGVLTTNKLGP